MIFVFFNAWNLHVDHSKIFWSIISDELSSSSRQSHWSQSIFQSKWKWKQRSEKFSKWRSSSISSTSSNQIHFRLNNDLFLSFFEKIIHQLYPIKEWIIPKFVIVDSVDYRWEKSYGYAMGQPCIRIEMNQVRSKICFSNGNGKWFFHCRFMVLNLNLVIVQKNTINFFELDLLIILTPSPLIVMEKSPFLTIISSNRNENLLLVVFSLIFLEEKRLNENSRKSPLIWTQFLNARLNVLINLVCRFFAQNRIFDKTHFQGSVPEMSQYRYPGYCHLLVRISRTTSIQN